MGTLHGLLRRNPHRKRFLLCCCLLFILVEVDIAGATAADTTGFQLKDDAIIIEVEPSIAQDGTKTTRSKRQLGGGSFGGGSFGLFPPGWPFLPSGGNPVSVSQPQLPQFPGFPQYPGYPGIQNLQPTQPPTTTTTTTTPAPPSTGGSGGPCQTNNGLYGYCASFRQCYPILYSPDDGSIMNNGLAEMYMNMSGSCSRPAMSNFFMFRADAALRQNQVCCGSGVAGPPQPQLPSFPFGQFPGFPFPQVTMRPPWAQPAQPVRVTTTPTTTTTTTTTTRPPTTTQKPTWWTTTTQRYQPSTWWTTTTQRYQPSTWWTTTTQRYQPNPWWPPQQQQTTQRPATARPPQTAPSTTTSPPVSSSCGVGKIIGGGQANKGEFPWLIAIIRNGRQVCGGSLIDSQHILTAAHCFNGVTSHELQSLFKIYIGDYDLHTLSDGPMTVKSISKLILHRQFHQTYFYNDIALLKLDSPVQFGSNGNNDIRPICLSSGGDYENGNAWVAGWGRTSTQSPYQPGIYRKVELRVWNINQCAATYGSNAPGGITSQMMCAGATNKDSCLGDSGGPLMRRTGNRWEQIGLVSWGIGCGAYPGVYTKIADYQDWISRHRAY